MKIAYVTGAIRVGGSEAQLLNLIQNLPEYIEPILITLKEGYPSLESAGLEIKHIVTGGYSRIHGASIYKQYLSLRRVLKELQPDIVQSHLPGTNILACFAGDSLDLPHILMEEGMGATRPLWEKILRKTAYRFPCRFVCNSESILSRMVHREKIDPQKITLIRNALTISEIMPVKKARAILGIEENCFVVFTAASLKPVKGIDILIRGFYEFSRKYSGNILLMIAGDGSSRSKYEFLADDLGMKDSIRFLGVRGDIQILLGAADAYVSSSLSEGLSNSIIEAMFSATPVIATDVGGTSVLMREEDLGSLIQPSSPKAISDALMTLVAQGSDKEILQRAREYVVKHFNTERVVKQFLGLYEDVLSDFE
ncbi:MAG: glycosyltransferase [Candidatus Aegiribacteria sp.]|nr:glycosyltransferase [Candidatus Aegiribacteria sp.]